MIKMVHLEWGEAMNYDQLTYKSQERQNKTKSGSN
jgi:hypothetical protein